MLNTKTKITGQLIKKCVRGNPKSQRAFFDSLYNDSFRLSYRYLQQKELAEDAVLKGFALVFGNLAKFRYKSDVQTRAWVKKIMINTALSEIRKQEFSVQKTEADHTLPADDSPDDQMAADDIIIAVNRLPMIYRTVFNMYVIDEYKHKEIAFFLNITEETSKKRFSRAKKLLQNRLKNYSYERI